MSEAIIKVLLIEDDQDDSLFLQDLLADAKRARFSVDTATTGQEGITLAQEYTYNIVLLDYRLPDTDGLGLIQKIQKIQKTLPIIMITSHGDRNLQTRALEAGAIEYLEKGSITADLLERACIYANGLNQASERFPELKIIIELVSTVQKEQLILNKEIVALKTSIDTNSNKILEQNRSQETKHIEILSEIKSLGKFRWALDWISEHRPTAILIFLAFLILLILSAVLLQTIDLEVIHKLLELKKMTAFLVTEGTEWLT